MIDLIYDSEAGPIIREGFPHVVVRDARDYIHEDRIEIELPDEDQRAYIKHAIRNGYAGASLTIQLSAYKGAPGHEELRGILDELKAERANGGAT